MSRSVILAGFWLLLAAMAGYEVAGVMWRKTPTLGDTAAWVARSRLGRWFLLSGWLWLGWHLFVRANWG
ncbi:MAG: DUF6186 family protein [Actinomycetota bacterium]|nr:DUF6186 family protein [Actinomycetota bacterium]